MVASQLKERKGRGNITSEYSRKFSVRKRNPKTQKMSRLGIPYPSIPEGVVKRFATLHTNRVVAKKTRLKKETLKAVMQASEWFLEQVGDDLGAFARHAGRKTIDESDVTTLMRRYVQTWRPILFHQSMLVSTVQGHKPRCAGLIYSLYAL